MPPINPLPLAPSAPPGPSASASATGHQPAASFQDVLTDHQARTDSPEGQAGGDDTPQASDADQTVVTVDEPTVPTAAAEPLAAALAGLVAPVATPAAAAPASGPAVTATVAPVVAPVAGDVPAP